MIISDSWRTKCSSRVYRLQFDIASVKRDERIKHSHLRLYTLHFNDPQYVNNHRKLSVFQIFIKKRNGKVKKYKLLASEKVTGKQSEWRTFNITNALRRCVRRKYSEIILEVRIESLNTENCQINLDIDIRSMQGNEPLLVVFSDPKPTKKYVVSKRQEMAKHKSDLKVASDGNRDDWNLVVEDDDGEYIDEDGEENDDDLLNDKETNSSDHRDKQRKMQNVFKRSVSDSLTDHSRTEHSSTFKQKHSGKANMQYRKELEMLYINEEDSLRGNTTIVSRLKRGKARKRRRRNICRRKPMKVNFKDINWHTWIIAPTEYQVGF